MTTNNEKILLIEHSSKIGGGQIVFLNLIERFSNTNGYEPVIIVPDRPQHLQALIDERFENVNIFTIKSIVKLNAYHFFKMNWSIFALLWKLKWTGLVYCNGARVFPGILAYSIIKFQKLHLIYHLHVYPASLVRFAIVISKPFFKKMYVICPSRHIHKRFQLEHPKINTLLIRNALDRHFLLSMTPPQNEPHKTMKICVIGKIDEVKGQDFIFALDNAVKDLIEVHLIGNYDTHDQWAINLLQNLPSFVKYLGAVNDIRNHLLEMKYDAAIVPSRWEEPFGLVAIESASMGIETIVRKRGGLVEIAETLELITFNDDKELNNILVQLSCDKKKNRTRSYIIRKNTLQKFGEYDITPLISKLDQDKKLR